MAIASLRRQAMAPPCGVLKRTLGYKRHGRAKALFAYKLGRGAREQLTGLKFTYPQFGPLWRHTRKVPDFTSPCASTQILCPPTLTKTGEQRRPQTVYLLTNLCPPPVARVQRPKPPPAGPRQRPAVSSQQRPQNGGAGA